MPPDDPLALLNWLKDAGLLSPTVPIYKTQDQIEAAADDRKEKSKQAAFLRTMQIVAVVSVILVAFFAGFLIVHHTTTEADKENREIGKMLLSTIIGGLVGFVVGSVSKPKKDE